MCFWHKVGLLTTKKLLGLSILPTVKKTSQKSAWFLFLEKGMGAQLNMNSSKIKLQKSSFFLMKRKQSNISNTKQKSVHPLWSYGLKLIAKHDLSFLIHFIHFRSLKKVALSNGKINLNKSSLFSRAVLLPNGVSHPLFPLSYGPVAIYESVYNLKREFVTMTN